MSIKSKIQSLISAANNATGESDTTLTDAVQTLVDGYGQGGGGGSGYAKKNGSFVLATDYIYSESVARGYSGSLLVDTGLSKIDYVTMWVEEWMNQTLGEATSVGLYIAANRLARVGDNAGAPNYYIPAVGVLKNNATNYFYGDGYGGIVTHLVCPNDVPEGSFGFRCRSGAYAIRAGCTVRWEASGTE